MGDRSKPKAPLWMRVSLLVSLAVNVLILAAVIGFVFFGGSDRHADRNRSDFASLYTRALSDADRRALRRDFVSGLERQGRDRGAFLGDMRATLDVLRATPFDPQAFVAAMAEQSERRARREEMGRQALANRIAAMSEEDRRAYADRIETRLSDLEQRIRR